MAIIKQLGSGYYVMRKRGHAKLLTSIFPVRAKRGRAGCVYISQSICTPEELVGKKVRLKVEVVEDEQDRQAKSSE